MNQKVVIGIIVVIALSVSLAFPIMYSMNKKETQPQLASTTKPAPQTTVATPPTQSPPPPTLPTLPTPPPPPKPVEQKPLVWEGTYAPPPKTVPQYQQSGKGSNAPKNNGPDLTAETLVGTVWQVDSPYGPVSVEFGPNGQAVAMHSMIGQIPASWSVQGNKVVAKASAMGQNITIDATIQGQTLVAKGQNIRRVR